MCFFQKHHSHTCAPELSWLCLITLLLSHCAQISQFLVLLFSLYPSSCPSPFFYFPSPPKCLSLPGISSSRQSLLLLLHLHHPPSLPPTAALCQHCRPGAAFSSSSHPVTSSFSHILLILPFLFIIIFLH